ncbi:MAG: hypothetical protein DMG65_07615 [Candidatus Angelobacter sp. Gp1-AA117]|nr:MAG: hypothetical protein DMG65_07615 [Candidatus Angelobacter sp. Gp1-AA117]
MISLAAFKVQATRPTQPEVKAEMPKWEYRVTRLEGGQCAANLNPTLASSGSDGWELVTFERLLLPAPAFPTDAQGSLLIKPAATGAGRENNPPTADSFSGTIQMKMPVPQPQPRQTIACQLIFKRPLPPQR